MVHRGQYQDHGYAWVVCLASFSTHLIYCGIYFSMGMFYIIFSQHIPGDSSTLSLVSSLNSAVYYGTSPLVGMLVTRFGERPVSITGALISCIGLILTSRATQAYHIYITFGCMTGVGLSLQCISALTILPVYFDKWLGVASGIACSGAGVGSFLFPYIINHLTDVYGWRGALILCGAIQLQCIITSALYRPQPSTTTIDTVIVESKVPLKKDNGKIKTRSKNLATVEKSILEKERECENDILKEKMNDYMEGETPDVILKEKSALQNYCSIFQFKVFTVFCISQIFYMMALVIVYTHIGNFAKSLGFTNDDAVVLFLIIGASNAIMRLLSGLLTQIPGCHPLIVCLSLLPLGLATCLFAFYTSMAHLMMYSVLFGMLTAPNVILCVNVSKALLPLEKVATGISIIYLAFAPGSLVGAPIAGWLYDSTGIYVYSFYLAGGLLFLAGTLNLLCLWCNRNNNR